MDITASYENRLKWGSLEASPVGDLVNLLNEFIVAEFAPVDGHRSEHLDRVRIVSHPSDIVDCLDAIVVYVSPQEDSMWDVLTGLTEAGAGVIILGGDPPNQNSIEQWSDEQRAPTLIWLHQNVDWADIIALCRTAVSSRPAESTMGIPVGDLFALANTISSLANGAAGIVDTEGRILAYSTNRDHQIDEVRRRTTLTLVEDQSPDDDPEYAMIYANQGALSLSLSTEGSYPRVAIAVRSRGEILATVWVVAVDPSKHDEVREVLNALEPVIAQHLNRALLVNRNEVERTAELLRTVLESPRQNTASARLLGLSHESQRVVLRFVFSDRFVPNHMRDLRRLLYIVDSHARLRFSHVVVSLIGTHVVALVDLREGTTLEDLRLFARRMITTEATVNACPIIVGISDVVTGVVRLHAANMQALDTTSAIEDSQHATGAGVVGTYHEWRSVIRLSYLTDAMRNSWLWSDDEVAGIQAYDEQNDTELLNTLIAYLRENGNVSKAAERLTVHKNTVRYRLKRIEEIFDVSFDDHHLRLWMWLRTESLRLES